VLQVPVNDSALVIDGRLDEPCWNEAAATGPLIVEKRKPAKSTTKAIVLRDADHLYVGVTCGVSGQGTDAKEPAQPPDISTQEHVALLLDTNRDGNSYYLVVITQEGIKQISYNEHWPPWHDRWWGPRYTEGPRYRSAAATNATGWTAEFALPFNIFDRNKTLTAEIGFNIRRYDARCGQTLCWHGDFLSPSDAGILSGIPARDRFPPVRYVNVIAPGTPARGQLLNLPAKEIIPQEPLRLGPGSAHPGTTGEVRIELEGFLLAGDPHTRAAIWDLAVSEKKGELYVLSWSRIRGAAEVQVFDRQGEYLRTIMPFNPTLPAADVKDLCRREAVEGGVRLVMPKVFQTHGGCEFSLFGEYWHLPQKMTIAPNGDLIMSNIYRGTLCRIRPDGSLARERWTSVHHSGRNEPFETACWVQGGRPGNRGWHLKQYLPYASCSYPYIVFDQHGHLYVSDGMETRLTRIFGREYEVSRYGRVKAAKSALWKYDVIEGVKIISARDFRFNGEQELTEARDSLGIVGEAGGDGSHFSSPCGLAIDGDHLIVADSGNHRLQVFERDGLMAASIRHYEHEGKRHPLKAPTALAIDNEKHLYVLVESGEGLNSRKLIKIESWRTPRLLAVSEPLHQDVFQIAVDGGVNPPLVWVANAVGPGTLLQLAGDELSVSGKWEDSGDTLSSPVQYGGLPILNIDPETGHIYVEDDSYYRQSRYGTVYRIDQDGGILKKWDPVFYQFAGKTEINAFAKHNLDRHFRYPEETLFIDSLFGKDGRVYRWRLTKTEIAILRFDRAGRPIPFESTGTNVLPVDCPEERFVGSNRHHAFNGMDVDRHGNIYCVARVPGRGKAKQRVDVYDSDGHLQKKGLIELEATHGLLVDQQGDLYVLFGPITSPSLQLAKFPASGGAPLWSRRWEGVVGRGIGSVYPCMCLTSRMHQALDGNGYLFSAGKYSVQVIDCETGKLVGEFGSYGNMDCQGKGSAYPHPELPFGIISALSVWKDRLFVVDAVNERIAKCRIIYEE